MFAQVFAPTIGWLYYNLGLDFWDKKSKIAGFVATFLVPAFISLYHAMTPTKEEEDK